MYVLHTHVWLCYTFNIKMHIYNLSYTNPRIINGCELSCFYDFKITSDKFYQHDYIIFSIQFLKLILFLG